MEKRQKFFSFFVKLEDCLHIKEIAYPVGIKYRRTKGSAILLKISRVKNSLSKINPITILLYR